MTEIGQPSPPRGVLRVLLHLPAYLYQAHLGFLLGHRFLLLAHRGRKSGRRYETVLEVMRYNRALEESTVMAGWGRRTQWLRNLEEGGGIEVVTARDRYAPALRMLDVDEAAGVLGDYERGNRVAAPLVRAVLSRLLGWPYDGSVEARRRAVGQLQLVAFRPRE